MDLDELYKDLEQADSEGDYELANHIAGLIRAQESPKPADNDFSVLEMIKNAPGSVGNQFAGIAQAVLNPIDTAKALGNVAAGGLYKANEAAEGVLPDFMTQPLFGDKVFGEDQEPYADAVGSFYKGRYGGGNLLNTIESDPAGVMMDLSGLIAPVNPSLATKINPVSATVNLTNKTLQKIPESVPRGIYERTAKFSTVLPDAQRDAMVDTAVKLKIPPTQKGVEKLERMSAAIDSKIDDLINASTVGGGGVPVNAVFKNLGELRKKKGGILIESDTDLAAINKYAAQLKEAADKAGKTHYSAKDLQVIKRDLYKKIGWDAKRLQGSPIKEDTYKAIAKGAKEGIEQLVPETKDLNKQWGKILELEPHLQRAANRIENRDMIGLKSPINIAAGTGLGGVQGATAGAIMSLLEHPKVAGRVSLWLEGLRETGKLRDFLANNPNLSQAEVINHALQGSIGIYQSE